MKEHNSLSSRRLYAMSENHKRADIGWILIAIAMGLGQSALAIWALLELLGAAS